MKVLSYPTTFVFDRRGKQVYDHVGALRERELDTLLGTLVAQRSLVPCEPDAVR